jgi:hypothetical protein
LVPCPSHTHTCPHRLLSPVFPYLHNQPFSGHNLFTPLLPYDGSPCFSESQWKLRGCLANSLLFICNPMFSAKLFALLAVLVSYLAYFSVLKIEIMFL